jgi:protease-4
MDEIQSVSPNPPSPPPTLGAATSPSAAPPVIQVSRAAPARRRGRGWMFLALALATILGLSLLANFTQLLNGFTFRPSVGGPQQRFLEEVTVEYHRSPNKILIIDLVGIILSDPWDRSGHGLVDYVEGQLERAGKDENVRAVILKIDSPGGEVLAADDLSRAITGFQQKHRKPVIASMGSLAASGGYYVAAPCRWIVANELTITGSIGVIMHSYNYRGLMNKVGVRPEVFKSGKFKDMLSGDKAEEDILPEERKMLQDLIDETFIRFKQVVREGREAAREKNQNQGRELAANWEEYADGRILSGKHAYAQGFVDELGNFDTAVERARKLAGIPGANLIRYQRPFDLGNLFRLFGETESRTIKVDLGVELPKLQVGRLYFLSPSMALQ